MKTLEERFWSRVSKTETCWIWTGSKSKSGYGLLNRESGSNMAHRISYELANGPIPEKSLVCHKCDNPPCVNPTHLFTGTHKDNSQDMMSKHRVGRIGNHILDCSCGRCIWTSPSWVARFGNLVKQPGL